MRRARKRNESNKALSYNSKVMSCSCETNALHVHKIEVSRWYINHKVYIWSQTILWNTLPQFDYVYGQYIAKMIFCFFKAFSGQKLSTSFRGLSLNKWVYGPFDNDCIWKMMVISAQGASCLACYVLICVGLIFTELYLSVISPKHVWMLRSYVFINRLHQI